MDFDVCYDDAAYERLFIKSRPAPPVTPASIIKGLQAAVHVKVDGTWDTATDAALQLVRSAAYLNERPNVRALQTAVGTTPDGDWAPRSEAALTTTVEAVQLALGNGLVAERQLASGHGRSLCG